MEGGKRIKISFYFLRTYLFYSERERGRARAYEQGEAEREGSTELDRGLDP